MLCLEAVRETNVAEKCLEKVRQQFVTSAKDTSEASRQLKKLSVRAQALETETPFLQSQLREAEKPRNIRIGTADEKG